MAARVFGIYLAPEKRAPMRAVESIRALPGRGLEGDRYALGLGTMRAKPGLVRDLSLISREALTDAGVISPVECRRNLVVEGVDLDALKGRTFRVGAVLLRGERPCEPCFHLERLTRPGVRRALAGRGGIYAAILEEGVIRVGDPVEVVG